MKKIFTIQRIFFAFLLLTLGLVCYQPSVNGEQPKRVFLPVASGTVSQANMKISMVDGTAFIDFTATTAQGSTPMVGPTAITQANVRFSLVDGGATASGGAFFDSNIDWTPYIGQYVEFKDSTGHRVGGYIKSIPTGPGETDGSSLNVSTCVNGSTNSYETFDGASATGFHAVNSTGYGFAGTADEIVFPLGSLFLTSFSLALSAGTAPSYYLADAIGGSNVGNSTWSTSGVGANSRYDTIKTGTTGVAMVRTGTGVSADFTISSLSVKQVLIPSNLGAVITSTNGGTTYNWAFKDASFNPNDSAGYTWSVYSTNPLPNYVGHRLHVRDHSGNEIIGYIKAAGVGETLSVTELITNGSFTAWTGDNPDSWTVTGENGTTKKVTESSGQAEIISDTSIGCGMYQNGPWNHDGWLFKNTFDYVTKVQNLKIIDSGGSTGSYTGTGGFSSGANIFYNTTPSSGGLGRGPWIRNYGTSSDEIIDNFSTKQVLTPSVTGTTIVSTKGGAVFNWSNSGKYSFTSFNPNDSSGYAYAIYKDQAATVVATGNYTAGNGHFSLVNGGATASGGAFFDPQSNDLSAYTDGRYLIAAYDSSGRAVIGYIKSAGGGETLSGTELVTNGGMETADPPSNWGSQNSSTLSQFADPRTGSAGSYSLNVLKGATSSTVARQLSVYVNTGMLYKLNGWLRVVDATSASFDVYQNGVSTMLGTTTTSTSWVNKIGYFTRTDYSHLYLLASGAIGTNARYDDVSVQQVLTPSVTGVVITNTQNGATYNWLYKDPNFDPNASGTYKVYYVGNPVASASQTITWASNPAAMTVGDADQTLQTTHASASSMLPVTFSVDAGLSAICTIVGNKLHAVGAGTCTAVHADQGGNVSYTAAPRVDSGSVVISSP